MNGRTITKLLIISVILLFLALVLYSKVPIRETVQDEGSKNCLLTSNVSYWPSMPGVNIHRHFDNGSIIAYSEGFAIWPENGKGTYTADNWTDKLGISPPCYITKSVGTAKLNEKGEATYFLTIQWNFERSPVPLGTTKRLDKKKEGEVPVGIVRIAVYTIPTTKGQWKIMGDELLENPYWFNITGGARFVSTWFNGTCTCKPKEIVEATLKKIKSAGFKEEEHVGILETEALKPMYSAFFVRDNQYLYVEFVEVKSMDLVRVLMIMGDEEVVKAYAEAFTAGSIEG